MNEDYIKSFEIFKQPMKDLVGFIRDNWRYVDIGYFRLYKYAKKYHLELHTGGWSGNESIANTFNQIKFIGVFHTKWEAGGHFYYSFSEDVWRGEQK